MRKQHVTHGVSRGKRHTLHCSATATHVALQCNGNTRCIAVQRQHTLHCSATATHVALQCNGNTRCIQYQTERDTRSLHLRVPSTRTSGCRQRAPQGGVNAHLRVVSMRTSGCRQRAPQGGVNAHLRVVSMRTRQLLAETKF
jgi:hypothetical protein